MKISQNLLIISILANKNLRKLILIFIDLISVIVSIFLSFYLNKDIISFNLFVIYSLIIVLVSLPTYYFSGQYKGLIDI